jgi:hypothetical protein
MPPGPRAADGGGDHAALRCAAGLALLALLGRVGLSAGRRRRRPALPPDPLPDLTAEIKAEPANRESETANVDGAAR